MHLDCRGLLPQPRLCRRHRTRHHEYGTDTSRAISRRARSNGDATRFPDIHFIWSRGRVSTVPRGRIDIRRVREALPDGFLRRVRRFHFDVAPVRQIAMTLASLCQWVPTSQIVFRNRLPSGGNSASVRAALGGIGSLTPSRPGLLAATTPPAFAALRVTSMRDHFRDSGCGAGSAGQKRMTRHRHRTRLRVDSALALGRRSRRFIQPAARSTASWYRPPPAGSSRRFPLPTRRSRAWSCRAFIHAAWRPRVRTSCRRSAGSPRPSAPCREVRGVAANRQLERQVSGRRQWCERWCHQLRRHWRPALRRGSGAASTIRSHAEQRT